MLARLGLRYAQLLELEQRRARHAEILSAAALSLAHATTPEALFGELTRLAEELLGASGITIYRFGSDRPGISVEFIGGADTEQARAFISESIRNPVVVEGFRRRDEGFVSDALAPEAKDVWTAMQFEPPAWLRALARLPLVSEGGLRGALSLRYSEPQAFPEDERELLRDFATHVALVLRNIERQANERRARELAEAAAALSGIWLANPGDERLQEALLLVDRTVPTAGKAIAIADATSEVLTWKAGTGTLAPLAGRTSRVHDESADLAGATLFRLERDGELQGLLAVAQPEGPESHEADADIRILCAPLAVGIASLRLEEVAREQQAREHMMATALANMDQAVLIIGLDRRVRFANPAASREYQYPDAEFVGLSLDQLVDSAATVRRVSPPPVVEAAGTWVAEHVHIRRDGQRFPASVLISYIRDAGGRAVGQVLTIRNLSEEQRVEAQLRQSEKLVALGELVAGVAHEMNNPLAGISAFAQLLLEDELSGDQRESIHLIKREADRAVSVIRDLLVFSRKSGPSLGEVDVNEMVHLALRLRSYGLRSGGVDVRLELAPDLPAVAGDSARLQQVLLNLVINAEHALQHAETKQLSLRTEHTPSAVVITVADTGTGMDEAVRERIFEPFFTTKPAGEGTGLGLSVSYGIVRAHGGRFEVESTVGRGTTFRVELPIARRGVLSESA